MIRTLLTITAFAIPTSAMCQGTTVTYSYDALGRLVRSTNAGQSSTETTIAYDPAGNRTNYKVTGAPNNGGDAGSGAGVVKSRRFVVVPLNGFTLIPIG